MKMIAVSSSAIRAVGYDGHMLGVQFHSSSRVYTLPGVPQEVYRRLMQAGSKGSYYHQFIRWRFR